MINLVQLLLSQEFHEIQLGSPYYRKFSKGELRISVSSNQSEITFNLTRKNGYVVPVIQLLSEHGLVAPSISIIHEDFHLLDTGDAERISEHGAVELISKNWERVKSILLEAYFEE